MSAKAPEKGKEKNPEKIPETAKAPRTRSAISPQKALAIAIAGLVAILNRHAVAVTLTAPEKEQIKAATAAASALNAKTLEPIVNRIKAIQTEFQALMPKITEPGSAQTAKDLSLELARLQKRLQALTSATAPAA